MSDRSKRLFQALCAVLANGQELVGQTVALLPTHPIEPLPNGLRDGHRQGFPGTPGKFFYQTMCFGGLEGLMPSALSLYQYSCCSYQLIPLDQSKPLDNR